MQFVEVFAALASSCFLSLRASVHPPVNMKRLASYWTNFHGFWYLRIFKKSVQKIQVSLKSGTLHEDQYTFLSHLSYFFLEWEIFPTNVVEKIKTDILFSVTFFFFLESRAVYEIMLKNTVERVRPQTTIWWLSITCWITKATDTHTQVV